MRGVHLEKLSSFTKEVNEIDAITQENMETVSDELDKIQGTIERLSKDFKDV